MLQRTSWAGTTQIQQVQTDYASWVLLGQQGTLSLSTWSSDTNAF
jgi:hypothetical protein